MSSNSRTIKTFPGARLRTHSRHGRRHLPSRSQCGFDIPPSPHSFPTGEDLTSGDVRAVIHPTLTSMHTLFLNEHNRIVEALTTRVNSNRRIRHLPPYVKENFIFEVCLKSITIFIQSVPSLLESWWPQSCSRSPTESIFQMFWAAKPLVILVTEIPHTIHMLTRQSSMSLRQLHSGQIRIKICPILFPQVWTFHCCRYVQWCRTMASRKTFL